MKKTKALISTQKILLMLMVFIFLGAISLAVATSIRTHNAIMDEAVLSAKRLVLYVSSAREYYSEQIVDKLTHVSGIEITTSPYGNPHAIPQPITLLNDINKKISAYEDINIKLYSNFPFNNRPKRILDQFQKEALTALKINNSQPYFQEDTAPNGRIIRVAIADYMSVPACINCHNTHIDSPKKNWKLGELRGVMEVTIPIEDSLVNNERINNTILLAFILIFSTLALGILFLIRKERYTNTLLREKVNEKTEQLQILNNRLVEKVEQKKDELTEKNRILIQQTRLAAMGEMVGAIAHQWRHPLNALSLILSTIEFKSEMGTLKPQTITQQTEEGLNICQSMSQTIDDFRNFFMPDKTKSRFGIKETFLSAYSIIDAVYKENQIEVDTSALEDIEIEGYQNEFAQVILNILSNAKDAMLDSKPPHFLVVNTNQSQTDVTLEIIDSGGGIAEETLPCIFEPNFTTKHKMQGMGIGLYMAKQIIEKHMHGEIHAVNYTSSKDGVTYTGAKFTLIIPKGEKIES